MSDTAMVHLGTIPARAPVSCDFSRGVACLRDPSGHLSALGAKPEIFGLRNDPAREVT
jgi:hypothetical protein